MSKRKQYTFDMKLYASIIIEADTLADARRALHAVLECVDVPDGALGGINSVLTSSFVSSFGIEPEEGDEPECIVPIETEEVS